MTNPSQEEAVVTVRQIKAARALLAWSQGALAEASGVSEPTVARLEAQDGDLGGRAGAGAKIVAALEAAGVIFLEENGEGPGVRLQKLRGSAPVSIAIEDLSAENDE
ncbi:MAG: helix-turn-helix transcriptional regulator [Methylocystis sp.]